MNILRAEEISKLPDIVPVTYNGNLIMIQHVDKNSETARIYLRNDPEQEMTVPVAQLIEK